MASNNPFADLQRLFQGQPASQVTIGATLPGELLAVELIRLLAKNRETMTDDHRRRLDEIGISALERIAADIKGVGDFIRGFGRR